MLTAWSEYLSIWKSMNAKYTLVSLVKLTRKICRLFFRKNSHSYCGLNVKYMRYPLHGMN